MAKEGDVAGMIQLFSSSIFSKLIDGINSIKDSRGDSLLTWAAANGHIEMVELLVNYGADCNIINKYDWNPLRIAASRGNFHVVKKLVELGADINNVGQNGDSILHITFRYMPSIKSSRFQSYIDIVDWCLMNMDGGILNELSTQALKLIRSNREQTIVQKLLNWNRRKNFLMFLTGCQFRPISSRVNNRGQYHNDTCRTLVFSINEIQYIITKYI